MHRYLFLRDSHQSVCNSRCLMSPDETQHLSSTPYLKRMALITQPGPMTRHKLSRPLRPTRHRRLAHLTPCPQVCGLQPLWISPRMVSISWRLGLANPKQRSNRQLVFAYLQAVSYLDWKLPLVEMQVQPFSNLFDVYFANSLPHPCPSSIGSMAGCLRMWQIIFTLEQRTQCEFFFFFKNIFAKDRQRGRPGRGTYTSGLHSCGEVPSR
jgi:hypothetical protein